VIARLAKNFYTAQTFNCAICDCYSGRTVDGGWWRHVCTLWSEPQSSATDCFASLEITQHRLRLRGATLAHQGPFCIACISSTCEV